MAQAAPAEAPRAFSTGLRGVIGAFVDGLLAGRDDGGDGALRPPAPELRERVVLDFDDWVSHGSATLPLMLGAILWALEWAPPLVVGRASRMSRLSLAERLRYFDSLEHHRLGLVAAAFVGLRVPLYILTYEAGDELALTGFDRPTLATPRRLLPLAPLKAPSLPEVSP